MESLIDSFRPIFGDSETDKIRVGFLVLIDRLKTQGMAAFTDVISKRQFQKLDAEYAEIMERFASSCLLHDYVNLRNLPAFLVNSETNLPFLHPLFIALISYLIGAPVRIVDARAKDAGPISAQAQDNMLHIDDVPFRDEYKVFVCWQKGTCDGPAGQNFVYLPGTNQLARDCYVTAEGVAYSTENGSVFVTEESVARLFKAQQMVLRSHEPVAIEVSNRRPTTIVFQAGALVHQRYRTMDGNPRSAIFVAFQAVEAANTYSTTPHRVEGATELTRFVLGYLEAAHSDRFLEVLKLEGERIAQAIQRINRSTDQDSETPIGLVEELLPMASQDFARWKTTLTGAPKIEELKLRQIPSDAYDDQITQMPALMAFDKHGQLDLRLYEDGREKIRKWARNRIREMHTSHLRERLTRWISECTNLELADALSPEELAEIAEEMSQWIDSHPQDHRPLSQADVEELIVPEFARASILQLVRDLGEAVQRCYSLQNFLSTCLFLFWSCDECMGLYKGDPVLLKRIGARLLRNYMVSAVIIDRCLRLDESPESDRRFASVTGLGAPESA